MNQRSTNILDRLLPFVGIAIMVFLVIIGLIVFSYIIVAGAIIGLVVFLVAWIKTKWWQFKQKTTTPTKAPTTKGRVIEHENTDD